MVYPGRPSRGCITCIARKVKVRPRSIRLKPVNLKLNALLCVQCDEGKPSCDRCLRRDQTCGGYRDPKDVKFVHATGKPKAKTSLSASELPSPTPPIDYSDDDGVSDIETLQVSRRTRSRTRSRIRPAVLEEGDAFDTSPFPLLGQPGVQDWEEQATCFFYHRYTLSSSYNDNPGWLDFLPDLFQQSEPESALAHSTRAISFASLSSASLVKNLSTRGHRSYGLALKTLNASLREPSEVLQDSLIVAILLLALYEVCSGIPAA